MEGFNSIPHMGYFGEANLFVSLITRFLITQMGQVLSCIQGVNSPYAERLDTGARRKCRDGAYHQELNKKIPAHF